MEWKIPNPNWHVIKASPKPQVVCCWTWTNDWPGSSLRHTCACEAGWPPSQLPVRLHAAHLGYWSQTTPVNPAASFKGLVFPFLDSKKLYFLYYQVHTSQFSYSSFHPKEVFLSASIPPSHPKRSSLMINDIPLKRLAVTQSRQETTG